MAIKEFLFDPALTDSFVSFGYNLYRGDPLWIPPLRREVCAQLSPAFPFYQKPGNSHRHFLATAGRGVVGRVTAMVNKDLKDKDGKPVGTIGFFESIDDYEVVKELLDSSKTWLREEQGIDRIWGPMNFDIWHGYRLMTHGFDQKPFYGEPYNKSYYPDFFERYGFAPRQHWNSVEIKGREALEKVIARGAERYQLLVKQGYRFERFDRHRFREEVEKLHSLLTLSFKGFLGFTPIPLTEFEGFFDKFVYAFHPRLFTFVYNESGDIAGLGAAFLELSDAVRSMEGKDHWVARLKFMIQRRRVNRINFYIGGVTPEEAKKKNGLGRAGFYHIIRQILEEGYDRVVVALMAGGNPVRGLLGEHSPAAQRRYTLYELNL